MRNRLAAIFGGLSICVALFTVCLCIYAENTTLKLVDAVGDPGDTLESFFRCIKEENWDEAYGYLYNYSTLGFETEPEDEVSAGFWEAQKRAWDFHVSEGSEQDEIFVKKHVDVGALDLDAMQTAISERVQAILAEVVENARFKSDVYDENGNYRQEVAAAALRQAEEEVLSDTSAFEVRRELTVSMRYYDGQWYIESGKELVTALTSGAVR